jgi:uncharacterized protein (DUF488 family)
MASASARVPSGGQFLTVGYEGRTVEELVELLVGNRVEVLVDVRENAVSRKPGFSKRRLAEAVEKAGIAYRHEALLGNPKGNRDAFRSGSTALGKRRYLAHLDNGSAAVFDEVVELAMRKRVALLCFERDEAQCHRACIVEKAQIEVPALSVRRL